MTREEIKTELEAALKIEQELIVRLSKTMGAISILYHLLEKENINVEP